MDRPSTYELRLARDDSALTVLSHRAREALSALFVFDLTVHQPSHDLQGSIARLLGEDVTLTLGASTPHARTLRGVITRVARSRHRATPGREGRRLGRTAGLELDQWHRAPDGLAPLLDLRVTPRLSLAKRRKTSRIFQNKSIPEIIENVLAALRVPAIFHLTRAHGPLSYCVQYEETDFAFVQRLSAENGLFFFFPDAKEKLPEHAVVFGDAPAQYAALGAPSSIVTRDAGLAARAEEAMFDFTATETVQPNAVTLTQYDFQRPSYDLVARATSAKALGSELEVYQHHGEYEDAGFARDDAERVLAQLRSNAERARGETTAPRLAPGYVFTLEEHSDHELNRDWVVVRAEHHGHVEGAGVRERRLFSSVVTCAPADKLVSPPPKRRRLIQVLESATVVGPADEEIHTDGQGRVKVRFHWDRDRRRGTPEAENSSCWIRVMQPWAGAGFGTQLIPRVGTEVLVSFLGGDTDRPFIVGCATNQANPSPFTLPQEKTRSGIRTRSTPRSEGYNELSFEDRAGEEHVFLHAERDMTHEARRNLDSVIGHDLRVAVARDADTTVGGDRSVKVAGAKVERIGRDDERHVAGRRFETVGAEAIDSVAGKHALRVGGAAERTIAGALSETVGGDEERAIAGNRRARVERDAHLFVGGDHFVNVGGADPAAGRYSLRATGPIVADSGGHLTLHAAKGVTIMGGAYAIEIDDEGIHLRVGETVVSLSEQRLYAVAEELRLHATKEMSHACKGAFLKLATDAELAGDKVALHADAASLELDASARLRSAQIRLDGGHDAKTKEPELEKVDAREDKPHVIRLHLRDERGEPYRNVPYKLTIDGVEQPAGRTGSDGLVEASVAPSATSGLVVLDLPEEEIVEVPLLFGRLPDIETVRGAKVRLRNLGYYGGGIDDVFDPQARQAVRRFQERERLEVSGNLDSATRARLVERGG
ncbi:MAG: type VI secretion system tip protein TssI/VgrG [Polyangiaceae bacterium]